MKCPICGKIIIENEFLKKYIFDRRYPEYKLYHCLNCDIQFWQPLKIIPGFYEDKTDLAKFGDFREGVEVGLAENQKAFFTFFPIKGGRLLDVGCGDGRFLKEVQKFGFDVYGIDFNEGRIKIAKEKFGIKNTYAMGLDSFVEYAKERNLKFDVITFFDVLEHQDSPKGFIEATKGLLKSGGWIVGGVPNRERFLATRDRKTSSLGDFPPHHFLWFNRKSIKNLLLLNGFSNVEIYPVSVDFKYCTTHISSIISGDFGKKIKNFLKKFKIFWIALFIPLSLILYIPYNKMGRTLYFHAQLNKK